MMKKAEVLHKTPKEIVKEMNNYIIGQDDAKKLVAIAFVNRGRRMMVEDEKLRAEITPKNVLLSGPTGVGKTEIARRVADITDSPFIKVEMTKFTEVGYAGKDVETIIRDLVEITIKREKNNLAKKYEETAKANALKTVADALRKDGFANLNEDKLANGEYDNQEVEIALPENPNKNQPSDQFFDGTPAMGAATAMISIIPLFDYNGPEKKNKKEVKKVKVREALETLVEVEVAKHVDKGLVIADILRKIEQKGVVFLDEIDKLISHKDAQSRGEVSREGVQRDLLPIIEGTMVQTKHGTVKTDHILFIAAGAFHDNKVSDLMPELQGRFPVQVELKSLTVNDFEHILTDLKYNLLEQQKSLLKVDGINVVFEPNGVRAIAELAHRMNSELENTGARRLFSVIEKVTEEVSYNGKSGSEVVIDKKYVEKATEDIFDKKVNVRKYMI